MAVLRMDNILIVVNDLEAMVAFFTELGLEVEGRTTVEGEVVQYEDQYRLCYVRGPEGIMVGLAEEIG